jgi:stage II sporulation protein D
MHMPLNRAMTVAFCVCVGLVHCSPNPVYRQFRHVSYGKPGVKQASKPAQQRVAAAATANVEEPDAHANSVRETDMRAVDARAVDARDTDKREPDKREPDLWELDKGKKIPSAHGISPGVGAGAWYVDGPAFHAPTEYVRVMLRQNTSDAGIVSSGPLVVRTGTSSGGMASGSSVRIERSGSPGRARCAMENGENMEIALPCTLYSANEFNIVKIDGSAYRGSVIIAPDGPVFSLVNYVAVDDYLRGVVPLEVGRGSDDVIEAVKAQAVAARTYTYRKMQENSANSYDMSATVADQVYGGVAAESELCNRAIRSTRGEVMTFHDSLIYAYYHSTCGGRTANIEDVWNKSGLPYLRSVDDGDGPYCRQSGSFFWEEQWPLPQFSFIVNKYSREAFPQNPCRGEIREISLRSRFGCGRVRELCIRTSEGEFVYGGDKVRFALRRNTANFPILKSSLLTDVSVGGGTVVIRGRGYGHGVGMCQTGALGRAKNGIGYKEIVRAYYTGIELKKINVDK